MMELSQKAKSLWGKLGSNNMWLPLYVHMTDSAEVARLLWDTWLPEHTKKLLSDGICSAETELSFDSDIDKEVFAKKVLVFLALAHDLGKASPLFQNKAAKVGYNDIIYQLDSLGLPIEFEENSTTKKFTHAIVSAAILKESGLQESYTYIIAAHHGKPPTDESDISRAKRFARSTGIKKGAWGEVQQELLDFAKRKAELDVLPKGAVDISVQVILNGLLIMIDWIASGEYFTLYSRDSISFEAHKQSSKERALNAWKNLHLPVYDDFASPCNSGCIFENRFHISTPRPMQSEAMKIIEQVENPGLIILEAPMGEGKTEAALALAEIVAKKKGLSGIYFALPTQATSDGIFLRIKRWIEGLQRNSQSSILLSHGKAGLNEDFEGIKLRSRVYDNDNIENRDSVVVNDWTQGRKKGLLSDFVVGTVDQILMCGLKKKHLAMRHLGVSNKVVIIDECHAYDTYMSSYLNLVLEWLGKYDVSVIMLSATLPDERRKDALAAYNKSKNYKAQQESAYERQHKAVTTRTAAEDIFDYPYLCYTDADKICETKLSRSAREQRIKIECIQEEVWLDKLDALLVNGGCVGIVRNTVNAAQATAKILREKYGEDVLLLHSRFISNDRIMNEVDLRERLGPPNEVEESKRPKRLIVVGTQVIEQSLDVDFDIMFSDICPMDLLLQRMGRLHRHQRALARPESMKNPVCYVLGINGVDDFDKGSESVYGRFLLMKTAAFLENQISIPGDIPVLVQKTYGEHYEEMAVKLLNEKYKTDCQAGFLEAKKKEEEKKRDKKNRARVFQIRAPKNQDSLLSWLDAAHSDSASEQEAEATVRDIEDSIEVIVVVKKNDGAFYTLPWLKNEADKIIQEPDYVLGKVLATCKLTLPRRLCSKYRISETIREIETKMQEYNLTNWYKNFWLDGELFLILDEEFKTTLLGIGLRYDRVYGLLVEEEGKSFGEGI